MKVDWNANQTKLGTERVRSGFLWFPKTALNAQAHSETRWMVSARWLERYVEPFDIDGSYPHWEVETWED